MEQHKYNEKDPEGWLVAVRNYLIGQCPDVATFLKWAEDRQHQEITYDDVKNMRSQGVMMDADPMLISQRLWAWLNLCMVGQVKLVFQNSPTLNGAEVWRRIVVPLQSRSMFRRHALREKVNKPKAAVSMPDLMQAINVWELDVQKYAACGGKLDDEDQRASLINMLPGNLSMEFMMKVNEHATYYSLKEYLRQQSEFVAERSGKVLNMMEKGTQEEEQEQCEGECELDEETVAAMAPAEVLAMLRGGRPMMQRTRGQRPQGTRFGMTAGFGSRAPIPPRGRGDITCVNCGKKGHIAADCRGPKVDREKRPCFTCGQTGHIARACPNKAKVTLVEQDGSGENVHTMCVQVEGFQEVRRGARMTTPEPRKAVLGDFILKNRFGKLQCSEAEEVKNREEERGKGEQRAQCEGSRKETREILRRIVCQDKQAKEEDFEKIIAEEMKHQSVNLFEKEVIADDSACMMNEGEWIDIEFEVALDSGSMEHVCDEMDTPGYTLEESEGSKKGQNFIVGDGNRIPNQGQKELNLQPEERQNCKIKSVFQIARVTRPLMSVGKICDAGMKVEFDAEKAVVKNSAGKEICMFLRKPGGLYTCKMKLKSPFHRQG